MQATQLNQTQEQILQIPMSFINSYITSDIDKICQNLSSKPYNFGEELYISPKGELYKILVQDNASFLSIDEYFEYLAENFGICYYKVRTNRYFNAESTSIQDSKIDLRAKELIYFASKTEQDKNSSDTDFIIYGLSAYIHSGEYFYVSRNAGIDFGFFYTTNETIRKAYKTKRVSRQLKEQVLNIFNQIRDELQDLWDGENILVEIKNSNGETIMEFAGNKFDLFYKSNYPCEPTINEQSSFISFLKSL